MAGYLAGLIVNFLDETFEILPQSLLHVLEMPNLQNVMLNQAQLVVISVEALELDYGNRQESILDGSHNPEWIA